MPRHEIASPAPGERARPPEAPTRRGSRWSGSGWTRASVILLAWIVSSAFGSYGNRQPRLILYVFPPLAVISAVALEGMRRLPDKPLNLGFVLRAMLTLTLALSVIAAARVPDSLMDRWYHARRTVGDGRPDAIAAAWRDGADRLLVYDFGVRFEREENTLYTLADWNAWEAFVAEHLVAEWRGPESGEPVYTLYRWRTP